MCRRVVVEGGFSGATQVVYWQNVKIFGYSLLVSYQELYGTIASDNEMCSQIIGMCYTMQYSGIYGGRGFMMPQWLDNKTYFSRVAMMVYLPFSFDFQ